MNSNNVFDMLKQLGKSELVFDRYNRCDYFYDDVDYRDTSEDQPKHLVWDQNEFRFLTSQRYKDFKKTNEGSYYTDVSWISAIIDSETDCVVFDVCYYEDFEEYTKTYGIVPLKMFEENGIKIKRES